MKEHFHYIKESLKSSVVPFVRHSFVGFFFYSLSMWSEGPNEKVRMPHLFKWRDVILESKIQ